jgi:hypothetical protein
MFKLKSGRVVCRRDSESWPQTGKISIPNGVLLTKNATSRVLWMLTLSRPMMQFALRVGSKCYLLLVLFFLPRLPNIHVVRRHFSATLRTTPGLCYAKIAL